MEIAKNVVNSKKNNVGKSSLNHMQRFTKTFFINAFRYQKIRIYW